MPVLLCERLMKEVVMFRFLMFGDGNKIFVWLEIFLLILDRGVVVKELTYLPHPDAEK